MCVHRPARAGHDGPVPDPVVPEVPDADAAEQHDTAEGELAPTVPEAVDAPEADALDQARPVDEDGAGGAARVHPPDVEASEADWLEQSRAEPIDDEDIR